MPEHDSRDQIISRLANDVPPVPSNDALERVRTNAITTAPAETRRTRNASRVWRFASVAVAAAAVVAVSLGVLAPRIETAAFARERAADALLMEAAAGKVLHVVMRYTETSWTEKGGHDSRYDLDQTWQSWVDPTGKRSREEFTNNGDGSLDNLSVRNGDHVMVFANNVRYMTGAKPQFIDEEHVEQPLGTAVGNSIDYMRQRIEDGTAKVTGTKTIGGDECWVVEWRELGEAGIGDEIHTTVTMRKSDYRLRTWAQDVTYENGDGKGVQQQRFYVDTIEILDPSSLPADTFDFDAVKRLVPKGIKTDKR